MFNYDVDSTDVEIATAPKNRTSTLADELHGTPRRTASEIAAEFSRMCKDRGRPDRDLEYFELYYFPQRRHPDYRTESEKELEEYTTACGIAHYVEIGKKKVECHIRSTGYSSYPKYYPENPVVISLKSFVRWLELQHLHHMSHREAQVWIQKATELEVEFKIQERRLHLIHNGWPYK
ncbi:MAG: hypothetical protein Q9208_003383 [Pyrenodesmia sp. 3 TL-2023]